MTPNLNLDLEVETPPESILYIEAETPPEKIGDFLEEGVETDQEPTEKRVLSAITEEEE